jgi:hypothetical protein
MRYRMRSPVPAKNPSAGQLAANRLMLAGDDPFRSTWCLITDCGAIYRNMAAATAPFYAVRDRDCVYENRDKFSGQANVHPRKSSEQ